MRGIRHCRICLVALLTFLLGVWCLQIKSIKEDFISQLQYEMLISGLSFLTPKEAFETSVLSHRSVPILDS